MESAREDVLAKLAEIIAEVTGFEPEEIQAEDSLSEDIGIESFDIVDINFRVEEVFGVRIGDGMFWNFRDIFENPELIDENNVLTLQGIREMKRRIPNLDPSGEIEKEGRMGFADMLARVKVRHFADFIEMRIAESP